MKDVAVYALFSKEFKELYIGMTNNLERRLSEHKRGQSKYTSKFSDLVLVHVEFFESYASGREREKYLKSSSGKEKLKANLKSAGIV